MSMNIPYVEICESLVELLEVGVVDVLEDERGCPAHRVLDDSLQRDDVGSTAQVLQDLDLALDLFLLDRLQRLDYAFLVVGHVDGFEDLAVLAPTELPEMDANCVSIVRRCCVLEHEDKLAFLNCKSRARTGKLLSYRKLKNLKNSINIVH